MPPARTIAATLRCRSAVRKPTSTDAWLFRARTARSSAVFAAAFDQAAARLTQPGSRSPLVDSSGMSFGRQVLAEPPGSAALWTALDDAGGRVPEPLVEVG